MRWPWRRRRPAVGNGDAARRALADAERKLRAQRRQWPQVDRLAQQIEQALRGRA